MGSCRVVKLSHCEVSQVFTVYLCEHLLCSLCMVRTFTMVAVRCVWTSPVWAGFPSSTTTTRCGTIQTQTCRVETSAWWNVTFTTVSCWQLEDYVTACMSSC